MIRILSITYNTNLYLEFLNFFIYYNDEVAFSTHEICHLK